MKWTVLNDFEWYGFYEDHFRKYRIYRFTRVHEKLPSRVTICREVDRNQLSWKKHDEFNEILRYFLEKYLIHLVMYPQVDYAPNARVR